MRSYVYVHEAATADGSTFVGMSRVPATEDEKSYVSRHDICCTTWSCCGIHDNLQHNIFCRNSTSVEIPAFLTTINTCMDAGTSTEV